MTGITPPPSPNYATCDTQHFVQSLSLLRYDDAFREIFPSIITCKAKAQYRCMPSPVTATTADVEANQSSGMPEMFWPAPGQALLVGCLQWLASHIGARFLVQSV